MTGSEYVSWRSLVFSGSKRSLSLRSTLGRHSRASFMLTPGQTYSRRDPLWPLSKSGIKLLSSKTGPNVQSTYAKKIPSIVAYDNGQLVAWGGRVKPTDSAQVFQVGIARRRARDHYRDESSLGGFLLDLNWNNPLLPDPRPIDYATDYLREIWKYIIDHVFPREFGQSFLSHQQIKYVLTVPAIWNDKARDLSKRVALNASFPKEDLTMVAEPEALLFIVRHSVTRWTSMMEIASLSAMQEAAQWFCFLARNKLILQDLISNQKSVPKLRSARQQLGMHVDLFSWQNDSRLFCMSASVRIVKKYSLRDWWKLVDILRQIWSWISTPMILSVTMSFKYHWQAHQIFRVLA
jgi:hypothetical protein